MEIIIKSKGYTGILNNIKDNTYNLCIDKDGRQILSKVLEGKLNDVIEETEFELMKEKFKHDNKRFFELIVILGANNLDLVQFIKNDLQGFKECDCINDLAEMIEDEIAYWDC